MDDFKFKKILKAHCVPYSAHSVVYHQSLCDDHFSITTHSLENVNGRLKSKVGTGFLSRSTNGNGKKFQLHYIGYLQD